MKRHDDEFLVDEPLVRGLLRAQFPEWADLPMSLLEPQGTDHTIYRLGGEMVVRMPIHEPIPAQTRKEARWVPFLAPQVPLELPMPLAMGKPSDDYPFIWSIVRWIEGDQATADNIDAPQAAVDLARFIKALQVCDTTDGPRPDGANALRGAPIRKGEAFVRAALDDLAGHYDTTKAEAVWELVRAADGWNRPPVWLHGDLPGNLIARDGRLVGAIDSGYAVGDPACDLMPAWTHFTGADRRTFLDEVGLDDATQIRARGWVLVPALRGMTYYRDVPHLYEKSVRHVELATADL
ncbi:MAG TPA: aminoglycoside phosphotransferase family protein [Acidimicrobiales bacterium]|nr:aminoglycoside phosphotransferase family protein [Acidimicrobiales bacterium]